MGSRCIPLKTPARILSSACLLCWICKRSSDERVGRISQESNGKTRRGRQGISGGVSCSDGSLCAIERRELEHPSDRGPYTRCEQVDLRVARPSNRPRRESPVSKFRRRSLYGKAL